MYQKKCIFHLILLGIPSGLALFVKKRGIGGDYLIDKICLVWQKLFAGYLLRKNLLRLPIQQLPRRNNTVRDKGLNLLDDCAGECVYISVPSGRRVYLFFLEAQ